jgi:adenosylmethionine-8-amino-7-oxononanoate aminotransferase
VNDHVFARGRDLPTAVDAEGCEIVDAGGRRYIDACGGAIVVNVGHRDPAVLDALRGAAEDQTAIDYVHATQFTSAAIEQYASELAWFLPVDEPRVYPVSGGSEAIETALKLARAYHLARGEPDRHVVIARRGSYHGNSRGALDVSGRQPLRVPYLPWLGKSVHVAAAYPYRDPMTGAAHAAALDATIREIGAEHVAAFVAEPIAGAALGASLPPNDYWTAVSAVCRAHGVLLIADEVMTGFGRTGAWFACEHWGVRPDILVAGKGASNGAWPLGLMIASGAVHDTVLADGDFIHGFTWSHHPIGARVALAVLRRLRDDRLVDRSAAAGRTLHTLLTGAIGDLEPVGDIRGRGLFAGIELVADRATQRPFSRDYRAAERVTRAAKDLGLLVYPSTGCADGIDGDIILLGPPFVVTDAQLETIVERLAAAIATLDDAPSIGR